MRRAQIQLDEGTYQALRHRAFERGSSISALAREILAQAMSPSRGRSRLTLDQFKFIGSGKSIQRKLSPVSERHDEALAEALRSGFP